MNSRRQFVAGFTASSLLVGSGGLASTRTRISSEEKTEKLDGQLVGRIVGKSHGDFETVKRLVKQEPRLVNATHDWGGGDFETPLNAASHVGRRRIAEFLLENDARIDVFAIVMLGMTNVLKELLVTCPKLHAVPGAHRIPMLSHAVFGREPAQEIFNLLMDAGADVNAASNMNMTPLMAAASVGHAGQVEMLLTHGADPHAKDFKQRTALDMATKRDHRLIVQLLERAMKKPDCS